MASKPISIFNGKNRRRRPWYKNPKLWRQATMIFFFLFLLHVAYRHLLKGGGPNGEPSIEAYCPFGGLESLYQFITTGGFVRHIEASTMALFGAVLLLTLLFSRGFCGWICPFGSIQEWIGMLGKRLLGRHYNPSGAWDRALRYFKYVVLAVIIALTWWTGTLVFRDYDPFLAFFHLGEGIDEKPWAYGILLAVLIGSLFIERFFCKYACPLGAALAIVGKAGLTKVHRGDDGCKACNLCEKACHAHVPIVAVETVKSAECNHCLDCVAVCPKPNVMDVRASRWRFSQPAYAAMLVVGLFGLIGVSKATHTWRTKPEAVSVRNEAGELEPEAIRGWMTLADISREFEIPLERLYRDARLPARVAATTMIKNIHKDYEIDFEPDMIREVVRAFLAGEPAPDLEAQAKEAAARRAEREAHRKRSGEDSPAEAPGGSAASRRPDYERGGGPGRGRPEAPGEEGERQPPPVRGNMTINEIVLKTGIPRDVLLREAGLPDDIPVRRPLRDWIHDYDVTPRDLRDVVEKHLGKQRR